MKATTVGLLAIATTAFAYAAYQSAVTVTLDGKTLSTHGWVKDGVVYIPANDVAKALGKEYSFTKGSNRAKIGDAGGASQRSGADGKVGDQLFNGLSRVTVGPIFPTKEGLMIQSIEVRNAEKAKKNYGFGYGDTRYTLYDESGKSVEGQVWSNDYFVITLLQAEFKKFEVKYTFPDGFKPVRMVLSLRTQVPVQGEKGIKDEVFRISF